MSSRLVKRQLSAINKVKEAGDAEVPAKGGVKKQKQKQQGKLRRQLRKAATKTKQEARKDPKAVYAKNLAYFKSTQSTLGSTAELMQKLLGEAPAAQPSDDEGDLFL